MFCQRLPFAKLYRCYGRYHAGFQGPSLGLPACRRPCDRDLGRCSCRRRRLGCRRAGRVRTQGHAGAGELVVFAHKVTVGKGLRWLKDGMKPELNGCFFLTAAAHATGMLFKLHAARRRRSPCARQRCCLFLKAAAGGRRHGHRRRRARRAQGRGCCHEAMKRCTCVRQFVECLCSLSFALGLAVRGVPLFPFVHSQATELPWTEASEATLHPRMATSPVYISAVLMITTLCTALRNTGAGTIQLPVEMNTHALTARRCTASLQQLVAAYAAARGQHGGRWPPTRWQATERAARPRSNRKIRARRASETSV